LKNGLRAKSIAIRVAHKNSNSPATVSQKEDSMKPIVFPGNAAARLARA